MDSKFFDIPFRTPCEEGDFNCKDGELEFLNIGGIEEWNLNNGGLTDGDKEGTTGSERDILTPVVDFAGVRDVLKGWHINSDQFPAKTLVASEPSMEYWTKLAAGLLNQFQSEAFLQNLFVAPFYVTAAWKMKEGVYLKPAKATLIIPNSEVPPVATDSLIEKEELEFRIAAALCTLYMKMEAPESLRDMVGKIVSLEVFISRPLHTYDSFRTFVPARRVVTNAYCESLNLTTGKISRERVCTETLPTAWIAGLKGQKMEDETDRAEGSQNYREREFYTFASIPLGDVDLATEWIRIDKYVEGNWSSPEERGEGIRYCDIGQSLRKGKSSAYVVEGKEGEVALTTRPLKLSGAGMVKNVSRIYLRGKYQPEKMTIRVYGSRDMLVWWCISQRKGGSVAMLPKTGFRFYKIEVKGYLSIGEKLEGISII